MTHLNIGKKNLLPANDYYLLSFLTRIKNGDIGAAFSYFPPVSFPRGFKFSSRGLEVLNSILKNWIMNDVVMPSAWQNRVYKTSTIAEFCRFWDLEAEYKISINFLMVLRDIQQLWYEEEYENSSYLFDRKLSGSEKVFLDLMFRKTLDTKKRAFMSRFSELYKSMPLSSFNFSYHTLSIMPRWNELSSAEQYYMIASTDYYVESFVQWESEFHLKNYEVVQQEIGLVLQKLIELCSIGIKDEVWSLFYLPIEIFYRISQNGLLNKNRYLEMKSFESLEEKHVYGVILEIRSSFQKFLNKILEVKREMQSIGFVEENFKIAEKLQRLIVKRVDPVLEIYDKQLEYMATNEVRK
ncbi:MAG: hypothetical protein KC646_02230 [Candidatus Cloacimonetes bacterium]|nr:hypothetical protein [Candidatus Cloacimonadota bacterium]